MRDAYLDLMEKARQEGAHAIVGVRYFFHSKQVIVYGTAVTIKRDGF